MPGVRVGSVAGAELPMPPGFCILTAVNVNRGDAVLVYLNGEFVPKEQATVSVDDRGFLFADGVYEVARVYAGQAYLLEAHLARLRTGLRALRIDFDGTDDIARAAERLIRDNGVEHGTIYVQVTRGAAPRTHAFPPGRTPPTVYVTVKPFRQYPDHFFEDGVAAITVPDIRWARCDIKSISLLANVLANEAAHAADAFEALFVRDGVVLEGSHSNLWAVRDDRLVTYPATHHILAGITRTRVFDLARDLGIPAKEGLIFQDELFAVDELFLSGTTTEILPVVRVDDRKVLDGEPGPITRRLLTAYRAALPAPSSVRSA